MKLYYIATYNNIIDYPVDIVLYLQILYIVFFSKIDFFNLFLFYFCYHRINMINYIDNNIIIIIR